MKKIVLVLGPTASGKSSLALQIAQETLSPIVNADSIQIYKGLEIGSSAPSIQDRALVPHFLYGFVDKGTTFTAAHYLRAVRELFESEPQQQQWILCGGSGFYLQAILKGMVPISEASPEIKSTVEKFISEQGWEAAHRLVAETHGDKIHFNDHYRIQRALEIREVRQQSPAPQASEDLASPIKDFKTFKIGLRADKDVLRPRVVKRIEGMIRQGFIEEVQGLIQAGFKDWAPMQSIGYFEVMEHLAGRISREELVEKITISTMQLIKKQMTWFKRDPEIQWFALGEESKALSIAKTWLLP